MTMPRTVRSLLVAAGASALVAASAVPAQADVVTVSDPSGEVSVDSTDSIAGSTTTADSVDIVSTKVIHKATQVIITANVASQRPSDAVSAAARISLPNGETWIAYKSLDSGEEYFWEQGTPQTDDCAAMRVYDNPDSDWIRVSVPRRCLGSGNPAWVRWGIVTFGTNAQGDRYKDDAQRNGNAQLKFAGIKLSRDRLYVG